MLNKLKYIYDSMPLNIKKLAALMPEGLVFGRSYRQCRPSFVKDLLDKNLYSMINYARRHTIFGSENYPKDFSLSEVKGVLDSLPFISSEMVKADPECFLSDEFNSSKYYVATTGGTGRSPTGIFLANESYGAEWAHMFDIWSSIGYIRRKHKKLTLRGKRVNGPALYEYNPIYNEYVVDTFRLNASNISTLLDDIGAVDFVHGYPSLVKEFMCYCESVGVFPRIRGFMLGSEGAGVNFKNELATKFSAKVLSWYGQTEKVVLASDMHATNQFKIYTSYGGAVIDAADGEVGEICGTTFVNKAMPLVKYRTGDYGRLLEKDDGLYLVDLKGRWGSDFVYLNREKKIPTSSINLHSNVQQEILFYQITQKHYGVLTIKILPDPNSTWHMNKIMEVIGKELSEKLVGFNVAYEIVSSPDEIIRSGRGKMMMLVQEIKSQ